MDSCMCEQGTSGHLTRRAVSVLILKAKRIDCVADRAISSGGNVLHSYSEMHGWNLAQDIGCSN
jgi:hypothetical protein